MKVAVTGGAGFIGSHLARAALDRGAEVTVLDDLSTGFRENVPEGARLVEGSLVDPEVVRAALAGADLVFHEAASRAVLRSVEDPVGTDRVNTLGTLNVLEAARRRDACRVVLASSSSVYGGEAPLPTPESAPLTPKSPYAVSKLAGEHYARVYHELYGVETVSLRYFNVFGPRQRPDSAYAAVIPLFIAALLSGQRPRVEGDGEQFRDFTYIDDVVRANLCAADAPASVVGGKVYNIARGDRVSILRILEVLADILEVKPGPEFVPPRPGDVRRSSADIAAARRDLGWEPRVSFEEGLRMAVEWVRSSHRH